MVNHISDWPDFSVKRLSRCEIVKSVMVEFLGQSWSAESVNIWNPSSFAIQEAFVLAIGFFVKVM